MKTALVTALLVLSPLFAQPQQTADVMEVVNREAGLEMKFRTPSSEYLRLHLKQVGTGEQAGRKLMRYSFSVKGLPTTEAYSLMTWDLGEKEPGAAIRGLKLDANGVLRCGPKAGDCPDAKPGSELIVSVTGMLGQPRRFVLSDSKKPVAMGEVVPFPAYGTDGACSIEAVMLTSDGKGVLLFGKGFQPGEQLSILNTAFGELSKMEEQATDKGEYISLLLPFVEGHQEGTTSIEVSGSKCRPATSFNWGSYREEMVDSKPKT